MLGGKQLPAAPFNVLGQYPHGFLGDFDAFAAINRGFSNIDGGEDFSPAPFALDPKRHCGLHSIFGTLKPAVCDGLPDKILLFGGEVDPHRLKPSRPGPEIKGINDFNARDDNRNRYASKPPPRPFPAGPLPSNPGLPMR
jgi:hypothetical protein